MRRFIFAVLLVLAMAITASATASDSELSIEFGDIVNAAVVYNSSVENAPSAVRSLLGDELVLINITREVGPALLVGLETENAEIVKIVEGEIEDPTILVKGEEAAVIRVVVAEDPVEEFQKAREDGEIEIEGNTFWARMKVAAALSSTTALRFFADLITKI